MSPVTRSQKRGAAVVVQTAMGRTNRLKGVTVAARQVQEKSRKISDVSRTVVVNAAKAEPNEEEDMFKDARTYHSLVGAVEQVSTKPLDTMLKWRSLEQAVRAKEERRGDLRRIYPRAQTGYVDPPCLLQANVKSGSRYSAETANSVVAHGWNMCADEAATYWTPTGVALGVAIGLFVHLIRILYCVATVHKLQT